DRRTTVLDQCGKRQARRTDRPQTRLPLGRVFGRGSDRPAAVAKDRCRSKVSPETTSRTPVAPLVGYHPEGSERSADALSPRAGRNSASMRFAFRQQSSGGYHPDQRARRKRQKRQPRPANG